MSLINALNSGKGALMPSNVKRTLASRLSSGNATVPEARNVLLNWTISSMPQIAEMHGVSGQETDSLQHYRFGFHQAERLIERAGLPKLSPDSREMLALFTGVHDMGRLMVGSGASADKYGASGNFLHPIAGAIMLREAFDPIAERSSSDLQKLFYALVMTAERHTLSYGLPASIVDAQGIHLIDQEPYMGYKGPLFLADVSLGEYSRFAHLVALADLINNVDQKLSGVKLYDPLVNDAVSQDPEVRIRYMMDGPGVGEFEVRPAEKEESLRVNRLWRNGAALQEQGAGIAAWLEQMEADALRFTTDSEREGSEDAFWFGVHRAGLDSFGFEDKE